MEMRNQRAKNSPDTLNLPKIAGRTRPMLAEGHGRPSLCFGSRLIRREFGFFFLIRISREILGRD